MYKTTKEALSVLFVIIIVTIICYVFRDNLEGGDPQPEKGCMVILSNWLYSEEILVDQENCEKADRFMKDTEWRIQHTWWWMNALPMWYSD